jgi:hypothetical protein
LCVFVRRFIDPHRLRGCARWSEIGSTTTCLEAFDEGGFFEGESPATSKSGVWAVFDEPVIHVGFFVLTATDATTTVSASLDGESVGSSETFRHQRKKWVVFGIEFARFTKITPTLAVPFI